MKLPSDILEESNWIRFSLAQDAQGCDVLTGSPRAVAFCVIGACSRGEVARFTDYWDLLEEAVLLHYPDDAIDFLIQRDNDDSPGVALGEWNDYVVRSKEEVVEILRQVEKGLNLRD